MSRQSLEVAFYDYLGGTGWYAASAILIGFNAARANLPTTLLGRPYTRRAASMMRSYFCGAAP